MKKSKKLVIIVLALIVILCTCGADNLKLNIDKRPVYKKCSIDEVGIDANNDYVSTREKYENVDIFDVGTIKSVEKNNKSLNISFGSKEITVKPKEKSEVSELSVGSNAVVFGTIKFDSEKEKKISFSADHIKIAEAESSYDYYIYDGKGYKSEESTKVSLADNRIEYMIPNTWVYTEPEAYDKIFNHLINSSNNGKCYYINLVSGKSEPEVVCIFYFDNNLFLEDIKDKGDTDKIELAIIDNICPEAEDDWAVSVVPFSFPTEESVSSNGIEFGHYITNYDNYRVEFAFTPVNGFDDNDSGGICMIIHMYIDDSVVPDDVLYVMNSLKIK
jgi:hypothetical protein